METARRVTRSNGLDEVEALLDSLDTLDFERWLEGARRTEGVDTAGLGRVVRDSRLQLVEWYVRDAVETIAWCRAPRALRGSAVVREASCGAARAAIAMAVAQHLTPREYDDLYGIFMRGAGLA